MSGVPNRWLIRYTCVGLLVHSPIAQKSQPRPVAYLQVVLVLLVLQILISLHMVQISLVQIHKDDKS